MFCNNNNNNNNDGDDDAMMMMMMMMRIIFNLDLLLPNPPSRNPKVAACIL